MRYFAKNTPRKWSNWNLVTMTTCTFVIETEETKYHKQKGTKMYIYEALYTTRAMRRLKMTRYHTRAGRILDAAIRAPHIGEGWRFILVDDPEIKAQLAPLYRQGMERMVGAPIETLIEMMKGDPQMARTVRSGVHLVEHFAEVPLFLIGFGRTKEGSGIYPARRSYVAAARRIGSTLLCSCRVTLHSDGIWVCRRRLLVHARGRRGLPLGRGVVARNRCPIRGRIAGGRPRLPVPSIMAEMIRYVRITCTYLDSVRPARAVTSGRHEAGRMAGRLREGTRYGIFLIPGTSAAVLAVNSALRNPSTTLVKVDTYMVSGRSCTRPKAITVVHR